MNSMVAYSLARLGLFAVVAAALLALPVPVDTLVKLMISVVISALLSLVLLRGMRDRVAGELAAGANRRAERRHRLRSALAGEDENPADRPDQPGRPAAGD